MPETDSPLITELRARCARLTTELDSLTNQYGEDRSTWPAGIREREDRLLTGLERINEEFDAHSDRGERIAAIRAAVEGGVDNLLPGSCIEGADAKRTRDFGGTLVGGTDAARAWNGFDSAGTVDKWPASEIKSRALVACETMAGLEPASRSKLEEMVEREQAESAKFVLALGNPAYRAGFDLWLREPSTAHLSMTPEQGAAWRDVEAARAAMGEAGSSALLPLDLDPSIVLTNNGSFSDVRQYAKVRTTALPSVRAVASAGVTAEFKGEGVEAADASPTLSPVDIQVFMGDASITVSYELFADTDIGNQLSGLVAEARIDQENRVFILGAGMTEPFGAVTRLSATTGSRVAATTASTFTTASVADVFKVRDALPARHRLGDAAGGRPANSTAWASNIGVQSVIQQMGVTNNGPNAFWAAMGDGPAGRLLGFPSMEATSMVGVGAGAVILALVNWSRYCIVDRLGTSVQRTNVLGDNQRSTGQVEIFTYWRYGGDMLDVNAGRVLKL